MSKHHVDFYCFDCLHSFRTEETRNSDEKNCKYGKYCKIVMPTDEDNILKCNHGQKLIKVSFVIYVDFETFLGKTSTSYIILEILQTTEINKRTFCGLIFVKYS